MAALLQRLRDNEVTDDDLVANVISFLNIHLDSMKSTNLKKLVDDFQNNAATSLATLTEVELT